MAAQSVDLASYQELYNTTAAEYLEKMKDAVKKLIQNPVSLEALATMHISAHSLQSQSTVMQYQQTALLCRMLEQYFSGHLKTKQPITATELTAINASLEKISQSLESIKKTKQEISLTESIHALSSL